MSDPYDNDDIVPRSSTGSDPNPGSRSRSRSKSKPKAKSSWVGAGILAVLGIVAAVYAARTLVQTPPDTSVIESPTDHPEMQAAIQRARSEVVNFVEQLRNPGPGQQYIIKVGQRLTTAKGNEVFVYVWLRKVLYEEGRFTGELWQVPPEIPNLKAGQVIDCPADQIADWAIIAPDGKGGTMVIAGGFTEGIEQQAPKEDQN